jgi:hypothetical protein
MRSLLAAQARAEARSDSEVVSLSTTGYGYRGTNPVDLAPVERELHRPR